MDVKVEIQPFRTTQEDFAPVNIVRDDGTRLCQIDMEYSKLSPLGHLNSRAVDFLLLASSVYALDKLLLRSNAADCWHREFSLELPVSDMQTWNVVRADINHCISFLTGDSWNISFIPQETAPIRPNQTMIFPLANAVCLFSGGLDSLIGVIDSLESNGGHDLCIVGHHDGQIAGPFGDQNRLFARLDAEYGGRIKPIFIRVGHSNESLRDRELTLRGRSLLFVALGLFTASALGPNVPVIIPENGTIALNVPLTPSRRGSCSTRTAHPHFLETLRQVLCTVGLTNKFINPLEMKTKGEAVAQCLNRSLLNDIAALSVSCAKRGHPVHRTHREAKGCGRCMPCIYRRAALHTIGLDNELYGDDVCQGEIDLAAEGERPNDLRACMTFLRRNPSIREISAMLMANGSLNASRLPDYAAIVQRAMEEIRALFRNKATPEMRRLAGV